MSKALAYVMFGALVGLAVTLEYKEQIDGLGNCSAVNEGMKEVDCEGI